MEKQNYYINLYDYYGRLLSKKQQTYFEYYYFNNLSLAEISQLLQISRNAIHKTLKKIEQKLDFYEEILQLYYKKNKLDKIIIDLDENIKTEIKNLY